MKKLTVLLLMLFTVTGIAQKIEYNYICPIPGSKYLNPEQTIILKTGYCYDPGSIHEAFALLKGSESGHFATTMSLSADLKTLFIHHSKKFVLGEVIHVFVSPGLKTTDGKSISSLFFEFTIRETNLLPLLTKFYEEEEDAVAAPPSVPTEKKTEHSGRDNNLPPDYPAPVSVYLTSGVASGYTFFTPAVRMAPQYSDYLIIWDNHGVPIYYEKKDFTVFDFKVIDDGILAYAKGANQNASEKRYYLMNSQYTIIDSVLAGNGYYIDNHDMQLLDNGHYLIIIYDPQVVNMSQIVPGGNPAALVTGLVIQEVDNQQNVYFQWRSWDHFEITDATDDVNLLAYSIDYVHANALDIDDDGHILLSSRNMDEITKINFTTGDIIWRFGLNAKNNQFTIIDDPIGFSHQHDIRALGNGHYTLFDNGNLHIPQISRGLEYQIDEQSMTATLVWDFQHTPAIYASSTGSTRRLPNNNTLIGWGGATPVAISEVAPNKQTVWEIELPTNVAGYRALKYPWNTTFFSTQENIQFGNCVDNNGPKEYLLQITNNYSSAIQITSVYNHLQANFFTGNLPVTILAGSSVQLPIFFDPGPEGIYDDILTLNYDNFGNTRRIARQVQLHGLKDLDLPSLQFNPENGSENVDPYTEIVVTFSEPVRKIFGQELTDADVPGLFTFKRSNLFGNTISFHGTVSEDKTIITIVPDIVLDPEQQYFIQQLPNKLSDYQGNVIDYSDYCFFTTGVLTGTPVTVVPSGIVIYPNPFRDHLILKSPEHMISGIEIFSEEGRLVYTGKIDASVTSIDSREFPAGLLTLRIQTGDGARYSRQIVHLK